MLRTEYYDSNRIRLAIKKMISDGVIDEEKERGRLPIAMEDGHEYYKEILNCVKSFLGRYKCAIDAVAFFEQYIDIRNEIIMAQEDPENASIPAAMLASMEFGKVIKECNNQLDLIEKELRFQQDEFEENKRKNESLKSMIGMSYNPFESSRPFGSPHPAAYAPNQCLYEPVYNHYNSDCF